MYRSSEAPAQAVSTSPANLPLVPFLEARQHPSCCTSEKRGPGVAANRADTGLWSGAIATVAARSLKRPTTTFGTEFCRQARRAQGALPRYRDTTDRDSVKHPASRVSQPTSSFVGSARFEHSDAMAHRWLTHIAAVTCVLASRAVE